MTMGAMIFTVKTPHEPKVPHMDKEALDGHVNHLKAVIRAEHKDDRQAYDSLVRGLCVAFQGVAPGDPNVKALARRLQKEQFGPADYDQRDSKAPQGGFGGQTGFRQGSTTEHPASATEASGTGAGPGTATGPGQNQDQSRTQGAA